MGFPRDFGLFLSINESTLKLKRTKKLLEVAKKGGLADLSVTWSDTEIEGGSYKFLRIVMPIIPKITNSLWISRKLNFPKSSHYRLLPYREENGKNPCQLQPIV